MFDIFRKKQSPKTKMGVFFLKQGTIPYNIRDMRDLNCNAKSPTFSIGLWNVH